MENDENNIGEIMRVLRLFPRFFIDEMNTIMEAEVIGEELEYVLGAFKKEKSPGLDGSMVEFYHGFYEFLEKDLLRLIRESRRSGNILNVVNALFIDFTPKKNDPSTFQDFRPISLCNLVKPWTKPHVKYKTPY
jgi:hypothetical protein